MSDKFTSPENKPNETPRTLDIKGAIKSANALLKRQFGTFFQSSLLVVIVYVVLGALVSPYVQINDDGVLIMEHQTFIQVAAIILTTPLITGLYMMGIKSALNLPVSVFDVFKYFVFVLSISVTQLLIGVVVQVGLILLILPGLYFWMATMFALPLVVEKRITPIQAIIVSCKTFNQYWKPLLALYGLLLIASLTVPLTFGLSLIWLMPFYFSLYGVIYNQVFPVVGADSMPQQISEPKVKESHFDA